MKMAGKWMVYALLLAVCIAVVAGLVVGERMATQDNADTVRQPAASAAPAD
ncbi:MAG: hypothetical protein KBG99_08500 [Pseudoxanthomonas sp.]|nr:hypothetical protein [Pseudoxanthomonas sp.]